jgi:S1-C subfamily serine protease
VVKTEPKSTALSVRTTAVQLGEAVFAVGTPLDKSLANSLTRGIVSAQRLIEGQPYIQSDVAVTHGNSGGPLLNEAGQVVGITVSGLEPNGAPIGLNFFIPIADALKALGIQPQGQ